LSVGKKGLSDKTVPCINQNPLVLDRCIMVPSLPRKVVSHETPIRRRLILHGRDCSCGQWTAGEGARPRIPGLRDVNPSRSQALEDPAREYPGKSPYLTLAP